VRTTHEFFDRVRPYDRLESQKFVNSYCLQIFLDSYHDDAHHVHVTDFFPPSLTITNSYKLIFTTSQFINNNNNNHSNMAHPKKEMKALSKKNTVDKAPLAKAVVVASTPTVLPSDAEKACLWMMMQ
jgi:hypothetical protein